MGLKIPFPLNLFLSLIILTTACQREVSQTLKPNQPPETVLANVPPENTPETAYFPLVTLAWNGQDNDGYVVGYNYRWITYHLVKGDSIVRPFLFTTATQDTIAFESSDSVNLQRFEVAAVDNEGAVDPTPAVRWFYTRQAQAPETQILSPQDGEELFVLPRRTDTWEGIPLQFRGFDSDGEIVGYSWKVDSAPWSSWRSDTLVVITPGYFDPPLEGPHTLSVKANDNTDVEDPTPATITIHLVEPKFDRGILLVDETLDGSGRPENPSDDQVDEFYRQVIPGAEEWDFASQGRPPKETLAHGLAGPLRHYKKGFPSEL